MAANSRKQPLVYIGTYTSSLGFVDGMAEGIYIYRMDASTGDLKLQGVTTQVENPSFLAIHPNGKFLYAVNETEQATGAGAVSAFSINAADGVLTFLNRQPADGTAACHVAVEKNGHYLAIANYGSGSVVLYPLQADGRIATRSDFHQHAGKSDNVLRQEGPHAHSINIDPTNRFIFVADLGIDLVIGYRLDLEQGKLWPHSEFHAHPGAGPRHMAFHPNGRFTYIINELDSTINACEYDSSLGHLSELQTVPSLPESFKGASSCADIHIHPNGRFLYGSNRGDDSLVIYAIDETTGMLAYVGHASTQGKTPRNFAIDPTGTYLYAANQDSSTIVAFRIDAHSGRLTPTGSVIRTPTPVCIKFFEV